MKRAGALLIAACLLAAAPFALRLQRLALTGVVRACVADTIWLGSPFPCLQVDLSGGEERGHVVFRPPLFGDLVVAPTRDIVGVEDPYLQSPAASNYFDAAWRARSFLKGSDGREPDRDEIALVVNSAVVRDQDQLHIHVGCLQATIRSALAGAAKHVPTGRWERIGEEVPHMIFWATRVPAPDLSNVEPFRQAAEALAGKIADRRELTIVAVGVRLDADDQFLLLASYAHAPGAWWHVGAGDLLDRNCPPER